MRGWRCNQVLGKKAYSSPWADSHRTDEDQKKLWSKQVSKRGSEREAAKWSAPPGYTEHHTGYAIDLAGNGEDGLLSATDPAADWVKKNAF